MNYELAKKLKDAGFKKFWGTFEMSDTPKEWKKNWYPTLSELIEACGDSFGELEKGKNKWFALGGFDKKCGCNNLYSVMGKTPEEAVANLWLELNKGQQN